MWEKDFKEQVVLRLGRIESDLNEHMRRTELLEENVKPLTRIYHFLQGLAAIVVVAGAVSGIVRLFQF